MHRFGPFAMDPDALRLFRGDERLDASPQAVEVLRYLILHRHRTVTRTELLERFWPRAGTGGDAALNTCIRRIRSLLEDEAASPRFIQTRPRSGYQFIGHLESPVAEQPRRGVKQLMAAGVAVTLAAGGVLWARAAVFAPEQRIAMEPVRALCDSVLSPRFNDGLRESFEAQVSQRLAGRYQLLDQPKGADLLLRISVRQTQARTLVVLTLVRARDGSVLSATEFAEKTAVGDYIPLQRVLATRMASALARQLG